MCLYVLHNLFCMDFPGHHVLHAQAAAQDPYKTLGEQGVDVKGEVQYTVAEFSVGTKFLGRKPKDMAFQREKTCGFHWPQWVLISFDAWHLEFWGLFVHANLLGVAGSCVLPCGQVAMLRQFRWGKRITAVKSWSLAAIFLGLREGLNQLVAGS